MPVDKNAAIKSGVVKANENIADEIKIDLSHKTYLLKKRPVDAGVDFKWRLEPPRFVSLL